jgi:DNA-binding MarR family transcriptional regulator
VEDQVTRFLKFIDAIVKKRGEAVKGLAQKLPAKSSFGDVVVLARVVEAGTPTMRELAAVIGVTPATATVSVRRAEQNGWIARVPDPHDRRITRIRVTNNGRRIYAYYLAYREEIGSQALAQLSPVEIENLLMLLEKLVLANTG